MWSFFKIRSFHDRKRASTSRNKTQMIDMYPCRNSFHVHVKCWLLVVLFFRFHHLFDHKLQVRHTVKSFLCKYQYSWTVYCIGTFVQEYHHGKYSRPRIIRIGIFHQAENHGCCSSSSSAFASCVDELGASGVVLEVGKRPLWQSMLRLGTRAYCGRMR